MTDSKPKGKPKALAPIDEFRGALTKMESQFLKVLPRNVTPEKFTRIIITAVQKTPKLLQCDRTSLYTAAMDAATDGLLPDARDGVIIPYGTQAKWLPMIGGILKKVRNSKELASISSHVVYSGDHFDYEIDENGEHITHKPNFIGERGEPTLAYAIARVTNGGVYAEVMNKEQIEQVKAKSPSKDKADSPWKHWPDEMWRKTVMRRLSKKLPTSTEIMDVIERDNFLYEKEEKEVGEKPPVKTKSSRLSKVIADSEPSENEKEAEPLPEGQESFENFKG